MKKIVLFGAGKIGKKAKVFLERDGREIACFIDNNLEKRNTYIGGLPVKSLDEFQEGMESYDLILTLNEKNRQQVIEQLKQKHILHYRVFDEKQIQQKERVISYSHPYDMEDLILYHVLYSEKEIFYIDVGSCDPLRNSVTKLLYDTRGAHGINVEPQKRFIEITDKERIRDINLCVGLSDQNQRKTLYLQGGRSTLIHENILNSNVDAEEIELVTLGYLCDKYMDQKQNISFLKIDVEGYEKQVLKGADFRRYRPNIVLVESEKPGSLEPVYEEWEPILLKNAYHYVLSYGVNRYYVADERKDLDKKFLDIETLKDFYTVYHADFKEIE